MDLEQLAINTAFTRRPDAEEVLEACAAAGFHNVEFDFRWLYGWLEQGNATGDLKQSLTRHGLRSIGGFHEPLICFGSTDSRQESQAQHIRTARLIDELGGGVLIVGTDGPEKRSLPALNEVASALRSLVAHVEELDVVIALEFNWSPLIRSLHSAMHIAREVNHSQVGVCFDPAHYYVTPTKFEHLTPETVPWIRHVHMDDMKDIPADLSDCNADRALPGCGVIDLAALVSRLEEYGYSGYYAMEIFGPEWWRLPAREAARRCYQSLLPLVTG